MAEPAERDTTAAAVNTSSGESNQPRLSIERLHALPSDQQTLYILTYTTDLSTYVESLHEEAVTAEQSAIKTELLKLLTLSAPPPARVIRNTLARCYTILYTKGNRRTLHESINELVGYVQAGKEQDLRTKHAATRCLGAVFEAAGDSAINLAPVAVTALLKLQKQASSDAGLRAALYRAIGRIVRGIVSTIEEETAQSIWKAARNALADRAYLVTISAAECLEQLILCTPYYDNQNDFDKLQSALIKAMDSSSPTVRRAAAQCFSSILIKSHTQAPNVEQITRIKKPKKMRKAVPDDVEDEIDRTASPITEKIATLSHSLDDILRLLGIHYTRSTTSNRTRSALAIIYIRIIRSLDKATLEDKYGEIARYLLVDLLGHPSLVFQKYRLLITRRFVSIILEQVLGRALGEAAQVTACRFLINQILKDYPQVVKERPLPSKQTLTGALSALNALLTSLGGAAASISELCRDALLQVHQHPSFTVQIHTSIAMKTLISAFPQHIEPCLGQYQQRLNDELEQLSSPNRSFKRCTAYAYAQCAILSAAAQHPLHGSVQAYAKIMAQAITLLKTSAGSDLHISACQIQVAWLLISGLMPLGPNFVKSHLQQLLLLWKNASPKPLPKESIRQRSLLELSFLTHVRECALSSIRAFLAFNQRLLTSDVSRRLAAILETSVAFTGTLPDKKVSDDPAGRLSPAFQLQDYEIMVNCRVIQCFATLLQASPAGAVEPNVFSAILPLALRSFSAVEYQPPNALMAAIANSSQESIWELGDNYGFGITSLTHKSDWYNPLTSVEHRHWSSLNDIDTQLEQIIQSPMCTAAENAPMSCFMPTRTDPAATEVVNSAIAIFALALPMQPLRVQESLLEQLQTSLTSPSLHKDAGRQTAVAVNTAYALRLAMETKTRTRQAQTAMSVLLHGLVCHHEDTVRSHAAQALGRLCSTASTEFTTAQIAWLTDTIVNNRDPGSRAGCSQALACIHSQLGGMAAGLHIKNVVGLLMSLSADSHPLVHFWAIDSLANIAESAGLNFIGLVSGTLGALGQLYVSDNHNDETEALAASNMLVDLPVSAAIGRAVSSLVNVLGPDLQDMAKIRDMVTTLINLFSHEHNPHVILANLRCRENLSLYVPEHFDAAIYVRLLQRLLYHDLPDIQQAAAENLCNVMRRDAEQIIEIAEPGLEERLWDMLDDEPEDLSLRRIFTNWLQQTATSDPEDWVARCNSILTKAKVRSVLPVVIPIVKSATVEALDDEVASFAVTEGASKDTDKQAAVQELLRWQVRMFAMECLHSLITIIGKDAANKDNSPGLAALQQKIAEIIRIAFSASTANVTSLRIIGLRIIQQILKIFGRVPDPDFNEAMLLEQYQAQISSALTPAFAADSSPALAAEAINVCATFASTGIVTDVERMGRTLKVLTSGLEAFADVPDTAEIGELRGLGANAQVMVRMAVYSAWAELQVASIELKYLGDVVRPHIPKLVPLWLNSLREYARLRFEPDISAAAAVSSMNDADAYAALSRQTLLRFYQDSWLSLVDAIASLIDADSQVVFDALDGKQVNGTDMSSRQHSGINYRDEPVAFFFVLFGLAFESLAINQPDEDQNNNQSRKVEILQALRKILRPTVSGDAVYQDNIFEETIDLMHRMVLTESLGVQAVIVNIATDLCMAHPSTRQEDSENLSDDIEQLFELTRIMVLVLAGIIPGLSDTPIAQKAELSEEAVALVNAALQALVEISDVFPTIIRTDLRDAILHIFVVVLGTGACQAVIVPQALPMFRRLISSMAAQPLPHTEQQLTNALNRMLSILSVAQRRENEASLVCEKNTLLACALLVSSASNIVSAQSTQRYTMALIECLYSMGTTRVATGCIRTLLAAGVSVKPLLAEIVTFLSGQTDVEAAAECKSILAQSLLMLVSRSPAAVRPGMLNLALSTLLQWAEVDGKALYADVAPKVIDLSSIDSTVFRGIAAGLDPLSKTLLGEVLRAGTATGQQRADEGREPTIALKLQFGGS